MRAEAIAPYEETATGLESAETTAVVEIPEVALDEKIIDVERAGDFIKRIDDTLNDLNALVVSVIEERQARGEIISQETAKKQVTIEDVKTLATDDAIVKSLLRSDFEDLLDEAGVDGGQVKDIKNYIYSHESVKPLRGHLFSEDGKIREANSTPYSTRAYLLRSWKAFFELILEQRKNPKSSKSEPIPA